MSRFDGLTRFQRWDPVTFILLAHAGVLLVLDRVLHPGAAAAAAVGFGIWRVGFGLAKSRGWRAQGEGWDLVREGGSLLLTAALIAADGGTESPFFFWTVILLAWEAMVYPLRTFTRLVFAAVAAYVVLVVGASDVTAASVARLGLLAAYCAVLGVGRRRVDHHQRVAAGADRLLRDAFASAPVGLAVVVGDSHRVAYANWAARELGIEEVLRGDGGDSSALRRLVDEAGYHQQATGPELIVFQPKGADPRYLRVLATPHGPDGVDGAVVVCAEDVTVQVTVGEERRRFLLLASHQLRTPLTPIIAYAELLKEGQIETGEATKVAEEILRAGRQLERLFERMATVTKLQRESPTVTEQVEVGAIITELERLDPKILERVEVEGDRHQETPCHLEWVALALRELLDNGHRFGQPPVRLRWTREGDAVEFRVDDAGPGPDPGLGEEMLFGDWGKGGADHTMPPGMGTRLGLLQARLLAELTGGELSLSRSGQQWAFILRVAEQQSTRGSSSPW